MVVRPFTEGDIGSLVELFADRRVSRFVGDGRALSFEQAADWVRKSNENLARFGFGTGAVSKAKRQELIGWAGIARPVDGEEEVIYGLGRDHWGHGFGRELLAALTDFAIARGINPVRATVDRNNHASVRLLVATGFKLAQRDYRSDPGTDLYEKLVSRRR